MNSGPSDMVLIFVFINNGPIEQNQKYLKRIFEKSNMKSGPSSMVLVLRVF